MPKMTERKISMLKLAPLALALFVISTHACAQEGGRNERVQFADGAPSKAMKGRIKGHATVNYLAAANAGQELRVSLKTSNPSSYFNVTAPGAEAAMFVGSVSGHEFAAILPSSGDYKIQVYLMRNAARRNEVANYTLHIGVK